MSGFEPLTYSVWRSCTTAVLHHRITTGFFLLCSTNWATSPLKTHNALNGEGWICTTDTRLSLHLCCWMNPKTWSSRQGTILCLSVISRLLYLWATWVYSLVQPTGIEPVSMVLQTTAMTTSARVAFNLLWGVIWGSNSYFLGHSKKCRPLH